MFDSHVHVHAMLSGNIPPELVALTSLTVLNLCENSLSGESSQVMIISSLIYSMVGYPASLLKLKAACIDLRNNQLGEPFDEIISSESQKVFPICMYVYVCM